MLAREFFAHWWEQRFVQVLACGTLMSSLNFFRTPFFGTAYSFQVVAVALTGFSVNPATAVLAGVVHFAIELAMLVALGHSAPASSEYIYRQGHLGFAAGAILAVYVISWLRWHIPARSRLLAVTIIALPVSMIALFFLRADFPAIYLLTMARHSRLGIIAADTGSKTFNLYLLVYALAGVLVIIQYLRHLDRARIINICLAGLLLQYVVGSAGYFLAQSQSLAEWSHFDPLLAKASLLIGFILRLPADLLSLTIFASLLPRAWAAPPSASSVLSISSKP